MTCCVVGKSGPWRFFKSSRTFRNVIIFRRSSLSGMQKLEEITVYNVVCGTVTESKVNFYILYIIKRFSEEVFRSYRPLSAGVFILKNP
jgi:hypothetical protein